MAVTLERVSGRTRVGGWLAVGVNAAFLLVVILGDVALNVLNGWTIGIAASGGLIAVVREGTTARLVASGLILLAMLPALVGGAALLHVPSLVLVFPIGRAEGGRRRG